MRGCSFGLWWARSAESTSLLASLGSLMVVSDSEILIGIRGFVSQWRCGQLGVVRGLASYSVWGGSVRVQRSLFVFAEVVAWSCCLRRSALFVGVLGYLAVAFTCLVLSFALGLSIYTFLWPVVVWASFEIRCCFPCDRYERYLIVVRLGVG